MSVHRRLSARLSCVTAVLAVDGRPLDARAFESEALPTYLCALGLGGLAYTRLRGQLGATHPATLRFYDAYCVHALFARVLERSALEVAQRLNGAGIPHLFFKGAAIARLYAEPAQRPYGDVDVIVAPVHYRRALGLLVDGGPRSASRADVHGDVGMYGLPDFQTLYERAGHFPCSGTALPTLDATDRLVAACLHLAKHGCERPIWLHDIARLVTDPHAHDVSIERLSARNARDAMWIATVLQLSERLLGAQLGGALRAWAAPRASGTASLARAVLAMWRRVPITRGQTATELTSQPQLWCAALRDRWPPAARVRFEAGCAPGSSVLLRQTAQYLDAGRKALWCRRASSIAGR